MWTVTPVVMILVAGCADAAGSRIDVPVPGSPGGPSASAPTAPPAVPPTPGDQRQIAADQLCGILQVGELPFDDQPPEPRTTTAANGTTTCEWRGQAVGLALTYDTDFAGIGSAAGAEFVRFGDRQVRIQSEGATSCSVDFDRTYGGIRVDARAYTDAAEPICEIAKRTAETIAPRFPVHLPNPAPPANAPIAESIHASALCKTASSAAQRAGATDLADSLTPVAIEPGAPEGSVKCGAPAAAESPLAVFILKSPARPVTAEATEPVVNGRTVFRHVDRRGCTLSLPKGAVTVNVRVSREAGGGAAQCADAAVIATEIDRVVR